MKVHHFPVLVGDGEEQGRFSVQVPVVHLRSMKFSCSAGELPGLEQKSPVQKRPVCLTPSFVFVRALLPSICRDIDVIVLA